LRWTGDVTEVFLNRSPRKKEIFGPVLTVLKARDFDEALSMALEHVMH